MSMLKKRCFLFCFIVLVIINIVILNLKNTENNSNLIGVYIDGEYASNIPIKDTGYVVEKIVCDNEAVGEWNYDDWGLLVKNMTRKSKCNVYFKKGIKLADTINLVDTTGKCPTVNDDGSVNVTSSESENSLLCMAPDNYGTSYYFRGNVQNNYIYFANLYWRIIRINGDGSIRMIYDGTSAHENGEVSEDRIIGTSAFNEKYDDNAYVGYMYGTAGSSTYEETRANIHDSTIKKYIDNWYENNIKNNDSERYLADNLFCNDRTIATGKVDSTYTNFGYGKNKTTYRWYYGSWNGYKTYDNDAMILFCKNIIDSLAVSSYSKSLSYPIGLINEDEVLLAGGYAIKNTKFYLYIGNNYWTMTPYTFDGADAIMRYLSYDGSAHIANGVKGIRGVKPVINLKAGSLTIGDGTISNVYRIS